MKPRSKRSNATKWPDGTKIAGKRTIADWNALKSKLKEGATPRTWRRAFENFFKARLETRYFNPIQLLERMDAYDGAGFSIVVLQCSLIEFLASTLEGKSYRFRRSGDPQLSKFEYSESKKLFVRFLRDQVPFRDFFENNAQAEDFYVNVRCALFHEARTKNGWRIREDSHAERAIDTLNRVVYRNKTQAAFQQFLKWYEERLPSDRTLQGAFVRKFDSLCEG